MMSFFKVKSAEVLELRELGSRDLCQEKEYDDKAAAFLSPFVVRTKQKNKSPFAVVLAIPRAISLSQCLLRLSKI